MSARVAPESDVDVDADAGDDCRRCCTECGDNDFLCCCLSASEKRAHRFERMYGCARNSDRWLSSFLTAVYVAGWLFTACVVLTFPSGRTYVPQYMFETATVANAFMGLSWGSFAAQSHQYMSLFALVMSVLGFVSTGVAANYSLQSNTTAVSIDAVAGYRTFAISTSHMPSFMYAAFTGSPASIITRPTAPPSVKPYDAART